jgi:hypothetical protein
MEKHAFTRVNGCALRDTRPWWHHRLRVWVTLQWPPELFTTDGCALEDTDAGGVDARATRGADAAGVGGIGATGVGGASDVGTGWVRRPFL